MGQSEKRQLTAGLRQTGCFMSSIPRKVATSAWSPGDLKEQLSKEGRAWEGQGQRSGPCGPARRQQVNCGTLRSLSLPQKEFPKPSPSAVWGQGCSPSFKPITQPSLETILRPVVIHPEQH